MVRRRKLQRYGERRLAVVRFIDTAGLVEIQDRHYREQVVLHQQEEIEEDTCGMTLGA